MKIMNVQSPKTVRSATQCSHTLLDYLHVHVGYQLTHETLNKAEWYWPDSVPPVPVPNVTASTLPSDKWDTIVTLYNTIILHSGIAYSLHWVHIRCHIPIPVCSHISGPVVSKWARLLAVLSNWFVHTAFSNVSAYSRAWKLQDTITFN